SSTKYVSTNDAGMNPRRPTSTTSPPLTTSFTSVSNISPASYLSCNSFHASSASTNFLDTIISSSSTFLTSNVSSSPSLTISAGSSTCKFDNSLIGIIASDFCPISTSTCFSSILTTVPVTMFPTSNSLFASTI